MATTIDLDRGKVASPFSVRPITAPATGVNSAEYGSASSSTVSLDGVMLAEQCRQVRMREERDALGNGRATRAEVETVIIAMARASVGATMVGVCQGSSCAEREKTCALCFEEAKL